MSEKVQNEHGLEPCKEKGGGKGKSQWLDYTGKGSWGKGSSALQLKNLG